MSDVYSTAKVDFRGKSITALFNECLAAIVEQGGRCRDAAGSCAYMNSEGKRCVYGMILPEELANKFDGDIESVLGDLFAVEHTYPELHQHTVDQEREWALLQGFHDSGLRYYVDKLADEGVVLDEDMVSKWVSIVLKEREEVLDE